MSKTHWDEDLYRSSTTTRRASGIDDFDYDRKVKTGTVSGVHATLDPKALKNGVRESRDSAVCPESLPIAIIFDVTGSMGDIPRTLQKKLALLMDVVIAKAKVPYPHVLVGAVGDATCDRYPFQIGQFESDNRFDEQLRSIILEGGGGGQIRESYGLAFRFAADHVVTDAWEKRGKKGYLFTIGDEMPWETVSGKEMEQVFGIAGAQDETVENLIARAREKWEIFHFFPLDGSYPNDTRVRGRWQQLLGERFIPIENADMICETIAAQIFTMESLADVDTVLDTMGMKGKDRGVVKNAIVPVSASGGVVRTRGALPPARTSSSLRTI